MSRTFWVWLIFTALAFCDTLYALESCCDRKLSLSAKVRAVDDTLSTLAAWALMSGTVFWIVP